MPANESRFWLVWCPTGPTSPSQRHPTKESARDEARRLARSHRGARFFVLEALGFVESVDVVEVALGEPVQGGDENVPF